MVDEEVFRGQPYYWVGVEVEHLLHLGRDDGVGDHLDEVIKVLVDVHDCFLHHDHVPGFLFHIGCAEGGFEDHA